MLVITSKVKNLKSIHNKELSEELKEELVITSKVKNLKSIHNRVKRNKVSKLVGNYLESKKFEINSQHPGALNPFF